MDCEGKSSSTLTDEQEAMEAVVNYVSKEIDEIATQATQGINEQPKELTSVLWQKAFHAAFVRRFANQKAVLPYIQRPNMVRKRRL